MTFYVVPKVGSGTFEDTYRPKYIGDFGTPRDPMTPPAVARPLWSAMDYGEEGTFLVGANLTAEQHAYVSSQGDVFAIPALETAVGGNPMLNRVRNYLVGQFIPGAWVQSTTTWRQVVGRVGRLCLILQRMNGLGRRVFGPGVQLQSTLSQSLLDGLIAAGSSLGLTTATLALTMTVEQALLSLADQLPPFFLAGETL